MLRSTGTSAVLLSLLLALALTSGCSVDKRLVYGPGGPIEFNEDLPPIEGEEYLAGGLEINVSSPNMGLEEDAEFLTTLAQGLREKNKNFQNVKGTGKKPVYKLTIYEGPYSDERELSKIGGFAGGILGGAGTYAATKTWWATGLGGAGGWLLGSFLFEEKVHTFTFAVTLKQYTNLETVRTIAETNNQNFTEEGGGGDSDIFRNTTSEEVSRVSNQAAFNVNTSTISFRRTFAVMVKGKGFTFTKNKAWNLAKQEVATKLPGYLFGGTTIDW